MLRRRRTWQEKAVYHFILQATNVRKIGRPAHFDRKPNWKLLEQLQEKSKRQSKRKSEQKTKIELVAYLFCIHFGISSNLNGIHITVMSAIWPEFKVNVLFGVHFGISSNLNGIHFIRLTQFLKPFWGWEFVLSCTLGFCFTSWPFRVHIWNSSTRQNASNYSYITFNRLQHFINE